MLRDALLSRVCHLLMVVVVEWRRGTGPDYCRDEEGAR